MWKLDINEDTFKIVSFSVTTETLKPALHTSGVECRVCFSYYRSLTLTIYLIELLWCINVLTWIVNSVLAAKLKYHSFKFVTSIRCFGKIPSRKHCSDTFFSAFQNKE